MTEVRIQERRETRRKRCSLPVQLVTRGAVEPIPLETLDISEGGAFIPTDSPLPVSTDVTLVFFLSTLTANVRASGTVVRCSRDSTEIGGPAGMAIEISRYGKLGWNLLKQVLDADEAESIS